MLPEHKRSAQGSPRASEQLRDQLCKLGADQREGDLESHAWKFELHSKKMGVAAGVEHENDMIRGLSIYIFKEATCLVHSFLFLLFFNTASIFNIYLL